MSKYRFITISGLLIISVLLSRDATGADGDYVVIVHGQSKVSSISASELANLYFKKTTRWKNGMEVDPVDLGAGNPARARFSQEIMGRPVGAVQAYWRKLIFSGKAVPPIELPREGDVLNYVSNHPGAIGYVAANTFMDAANVKKVRVTDN